ETPAPVRDPLDALGDERQQLGRRRLELDVGERDPLSRSHLAAEDCASRKADREAVVLARNGDEEAVGAEAALAVQRLARVEVALRGRDDAGTEPVGRARRLAAEPGPDDRDRELEPDEVERPPERRMRPVRRSAVLAERDLGLLVRHLEDDVDAPPER